VFVRGEVVHDDVHLQVLGHVLFDLPEKTQIFLMPMARPTLREDFAVGTSVLGLARLVAYRKRLTGKSSR
jgi:hypothetical protein